MNHSDDVPVAHEIGAEIVTKEIINDDLEPLSALLRTCADRSDVNLIVTTGGTGFGPRDNTPRYALSAAQSPAR